MFKVIFLVLSMIMSVIHFGLFCLIIIQKQEKYPWKVFAGCIAGCCVCTISYALSVSTDSYFLMSLFSSIYFASIDVILICLFLYTLKLTERQLEGIFKVGILTSVGYGVFDIVIMMINPFIQIAINYQYVPNALYVKWSYDPYLLYNLHLLYCYIMVAFSFFNLLSKSAMIPRIYRRKFSLIIEGLIVIVFLNGLFLYLPVLKILEYDISIFFYSIVGILIYYNTMYYANHSLMNGISKEILHNMQYPVILFDYDENYVLHIQGELQIFPENVNKLTLDDLMKTLDLQDHMKDKNQNTSFQWIHQSIVYRCDYRVMKKKESIVGYYFTFVNVPYEYDLLTTFHTENATLQFIEKEELQYPVGILVCDLNKLTQINEVYGKNIGDKAIETVASTMQNVCPKDTYFSRLHDALLVAICPDCNLAMINDLSSEMMKMEMTLSNPTVELQIQCATAVCTMAKNSNIIAGIKSAQESLRVKKMLDPDSIHSSLLYSLVRILQEADQGTEQHVLRTRELGKMFGKKLELSDEEISNLELLCLLHDVGKICVPLEILNKPGKLNDDEWRVMKSHAEKGFIIASSSRELRNIADKILHHHEFWNGKGYPSGLIREEIPLLSRMISIIDSYDAMISDRPYRDNIGTENAVKELERYAGVQFDPYLITEFVEMLRENPQFTREATIQEVGEVFENTWENYQNEYPEEQVTIPISDVVYSRYVIDPDTKLIHRVDDRFEEITGYSLEDVKNLQLSQDDLIFREDAGRYWALVAQFNSQGLETYIEHRLRRKDGTEIFVYCDGLTSFDSALNKNVVNILISDISSSIALHKAVETERNIARINQERWMESLRLDPMCGILNRMTFRNEIQTLLLRDDTTVVMMMSDLDNFKKINDNFGHITGDNLLKGYAKILVDAVEKDEIVCRMGGDEFAAALLFDKNCPIEVIAERIEKLWKEINQSLKIYGNSISSSMGFSISNGKEKSFNIMYQESDQALYKAKESGKNQWFIGGENG